MGRCTKNMGKKSEERDGGRIGDGNEGKEEENS
jgi:hypothetical protein